MRSRVTVWETMLELDAFEAQAGAKNPGAATMLIDMQKASE